MEYIDFHPGQIPEELAEKLAETLTPPLAAPMFPPGAIVTTSVSVVNSQRDIKQHSVPNAIAKLLNFCSNLFLHFHTRPRFLGDF